MPWALPESCDSYLHFLQCFTLKQPWLPLCNTEITQGRSISTASPAVPGVLQEAKGCTDVGGEGSLQGQSWSSSLGDARARPVGFACPPTGSIQPVPHITQYQAANQRKTSKGFSFPHVQAQSSEPCRGHTENEPPSPHPKEVRSTHCPTDSKIMQRQRHFQNTYVCAYSRYSSSYA